VRRYHFDTMPIHPQPETFESLTSYVIRLAQANGIQARNHLHTIFFPSRSPTSIRAMADLPLTDYDDFSAVAACSETELQATTFYYLSSRFNRPTSAPMVSYFLAAGTPGVLARRLRYCPICLQDDLPYYSLTWRFLTLPGCPRHGCQFLAHCLHCGHTFFASASQNRSVSGVRSTIEYQPCRTFGSPPAPRSSSSLPRPGFSSFTVGGRDRATSRRATTGSVATDQATDD